MAISGAASLIKEQAADDERGVRMRVWTDQILRSVGFMERLVRDLLDFRSFEDGQLRVTADRQDIRGLIRSAVAASTFYITLPEK